MAFVDLVFCSYEHLNHLLGHIEGIGFRAEEGQRVRAVVKERPPDLRRQPLTHPSWGTLRSPTMRPSRRTRSRGVVEPNSKPGLADLHLLPSPNGSLWPAWVSHLTLVRSLTIFAQPWVVRGASKGENGLVFTISVLLVCVRPCHPIPQRPSCSGQGLRSQLGLHLNPGSVHLL